MKQHLADQLVLFIDDVATLDKHLVSLVLLLVVVVIVLDGATLWARKKSKAVGLTEAARPISIEGGKTIPGRNYISEIQGLSGTPDAVIVERGELIPVEVKPLAKKVRDRYIAQLLVYMRLVEEFEGKKPPYGYLILGPKSRRIKIENSKHRQLWLDNQISAMLSVLEERASTVPKPQRQKCQRCSVESFCQWSEKESHFNIT